MMSIDFQELYCKAEELAEDALATATKARGEAAGYDPRAVYKLWVGEDFLAVRISEQRSFEYYGGMEYVDDQYRMLLGGYVFYSTEDARVERHHAEAMSE